MALTKDDLVDALRQVRGAPAAPVDLGAGGATGLLKGLGDTAQMAGSAIKGLVEGNVKFSDAVGGAGQVIGKLGTAGKIAGDSLTYMGKYAQESVDAMRNFGKFGAGFNGDAINMRSSIAQTRMSLEEYGKFLNKNTSILNAMGGSVTQGTTKFNEFSQAFFDQQAKQGDAFGSVSDQLRNLGMTSEEINGTLAIELASRRFQNMEDTKSREEAIASAAEMATEMDKIAKLTGKSRETQQAELAALEKDGQYQAAIRLAQRDGNTFAAKGMQEAMTSMGKFGAPVQNLVKDFLAFGTASKDTQDTLAALGPAGTELQNAIQMVKSAKTEEQKIAAQSALKRAEESVTSEVNSRRMLENAQLGIKGFKGLADSTTTVTAGMDKVAAENKLNLDLEVDRRKAAQILNAQVKKEQEDAKKPAKPGEADAGKATTQAIVQFEKVMQDSGAAIQEQFVNRLNKEIAPGMIEFTQFLKAPGLSRERQAGAIEKGYTGVKQAFENPGQQADDTAKKGAAASEAVRAAGGTEDEAKRAALREERKVRPDSRQPSDNNQTVPVRVTNINEITPASPRFGGTIGMTGNLFEKPGLINIDRPDETVLTSEHLMNLAKGAQITGVKSSLDKFTQAVNPNAAKTAMPKVEVPKFEMPKIEVPKVEAPQFDMSKFDMSKFDMSKVQMPKVEVPKFEMPKFDMSQFDMSKVQMPKVEVPKVEVPKFDMPKFEMPKFEMPKFDASTLKGTITENGKTREMSQTDLSKATNDISKMMGNLDLTQLSKNFTTQISSVTNGIKETVSGGDSKTVKGPDITELSKSFEKSFADMAKNSASQEIGQPTAGNLGMPAAGSQLTESASIEKLAQEQALASKKKQAESSVESAKIYKNSSEKFVSFLEKDIAAKEQELAATDSERQKRRLENELLTQRTKLDGAKSQVIEDTKNLLTAEKELADAQQQSVAAEASIREETIQQTNNIAEQTQSMLATKKEFSESELQQIGHELSALANEKEVQSIRQAGVQTGLDKLQAQKDIYENNQRYEERDLAESTEELAILRNRLDNSESAAEIQELQAQIADEESINLSLQNRIAERNQNILNVNADIALKEQELQDLKEEMADTEIAIQDKQSQLLDHVDNQSEIVTESDDDLALYGANQPEITEESPEDLALYGANQTPRDDEFGDLAGAIAKNKTQTTTGRDPFTSMLDRFMGPMAGPSSATAGVDAAKNSAVKDAEKKDAEAKQAQTAKTATASDAKPKTATGAGKEASMSDLLASMDQLNMQVGKLAGEMSRLPNLMEKAVSATKALNGNLNMRA
jgi:hypothetical protein